MKKIVISLSLLILVFVLAACGETDPVDYSVTGIKYENDTLSWVCDTSSKFVVKIGEESTEVEGKSIALPLNDLFSKGIDTIININAVEDSENISTFTIKILPKVQNIEIVDGIVSWDAIPDAKYQIMVDEVEQANLLDVNSYDGIVAGHPTRFKVRAFKDATDTECYISQYCEEVTCNLLPTPIMEPFHNATTTIQWKPVAEARGYSVRIMLNGVAVEQKNLPSNMTKLAYEGFTSAGTYAIQVKATSEKEDQLQDSKYSEIMEVIRLAAPSTMKFEDAPNNTTTISINAVEHAVSYVFKVDGVEKENRYETEFKYAFDKSSVEVKRNIEIYAKGDGKQVLDSLTPVKGTITQLAIPKNVIMSDGLLKWDSVTNANGYMVTIDGTAVPVEHAQLNLLGLNLTEGEHEYSVRAKGNDEMIVSSWNSSKENFSKLIKPTSLKIKNNVLSWDIVTGASSYVIEMGKVVISNTSTNSYEINPSDIIENTEIKVIAKGNGKKILDSEYSTPYRVYKLSTPQNLSTTNSNMMWDSVKNAKSYQLYVGSNVRSIDKGTSYPWDEFDAGIYNIKIKAVGDASTYFDSDFTKVLTIKKLQAPIASVGEKQFEWTSVASASRYEVALQGEFDYAKKGELSYTKQFSEAGEYHFLVRAEGDAKETVSSKWSNELVHWVKTLPQLATSDFTVTKIENGLNVTINKAIPNASKYCVSVGGVENIKEIGNKSYDIVVDTIGTVLVKCKAVGDKFNYVDANYSMNKKLIFLPGVTNIRWSKDSENYYIINWDAVDDAISYKITIKKYNALGEIVDEEFTDFLNVTEQGISTIGVNSVHVVIEAIGNGETIYSSEKVEKDLLI